MATRAVLCAPAGGELGPAAAKVASDTTEPRNETLTAAQPVVSLRDMGTSHSREEPVRALDAGADDTTVHAGFRLPPLG